MGNELKKLMFDYQKSAVDQLMAKADQMSASFLREFENFNPEMQKISFQKLKFETDELETVISEEALKFHHGTLYQNYVKKFNETGAGFQEAGAILHERFFDGLTQPHSGEVNDETAENFLVQRFGSVEEFKKQFKDRAMRLEGSGWVELSRAGVIKIIPEHLPVRDSLLLIDLWEHAYILDYREDREKYIDNFWLIVDWSVVGERLNEKR